MQAIFLLFLICHLVFVCIAISNLLLARKLQNNIRDSKKSSLISILIPVRNEEKNLRNLLPTLSTQTYQNLEIIVCDDGSNDKSREVVTELQKSMNNLKLIDGIPLPKGWLGKNWACFQLSQKARGEILIFLDADVTLDKNAVEFAHNQFYSSSNIGLLSIFPTQITKTFGEKMVVPLMNWFLLTFLALDLVTKSKSSKFVAANGQFLMFDRETYFNIGAHQIVRNKVVEDMELAFLVKKSGKKALPLLGSNFVFCRMYESFSDSIKGFTKNFYLGTKLSAAGFFVLINLILFLFLSPFLLIFLNSKFVLVIFLICMNRIFVAILSKRNAVLEVLLHPIQMCLFWFIAFRSFFATQQKNVEWKGRNVNL